MNETAAPTRTSTRAAWALWTVTIVILLATGIFSSAVFEIGLGLGLVGEEVHRWGAVVLSLAIPLIPVSVGIAVLLRDEVEPAAIVRSLRVGAQETVQPGSVSLWVRPGWVPVAQGGLST